MDAIVSGERRRAVQRLFRLVKRRRRDANGLACVGTYRSPTARAHHHYSAGLHGPVVGAGARVSSKRPN